MNIFGMKLVQTPGPATMPAEVLEAMGRQSIDHRSAEFADLTQRLLGGLGTLFDTEDPVVLFAASGTGAWEAALVNTVSPGDRVLVVDNGYFAGKWADLAGDLGLSVTRLRLPWDQPVDLQRVAEALTRSEPEVAAVCVVHGETSTGAVADVAAVRQLLDDLDHPALLLVDAISSAMVNDYRHDQWRVDVTVCASQKGFMSPPGVGLNVVSPKARLSRSSYPRHYWGWEETIEQNAAGFFPRTPATNVLFAMDAAIRLIQAETLPAVLSRQGRLAEATRCAISTWGLPLIAPQATPSNGVSAFRLPDGCDSDELHDLLLEVYGVATGRGLGELRGRALRIGHLGATTETTLLAALGAVDLGLRRLRVSLGRGGVDAALDVLAANPAGRPAVL